MNFTQINQAKFSEINQIVFQSSGMSFRITQRFNDFETNPKIKKIYTEQGRIGHDGLDIVVFDDVRAVEGGEVIFADWDSKMTWATKGMYFGFGIMTIIWNKENNRLWVYAHLSENLSLEVGQIVKKGDYVGQMGGSGRGNQNIWDVHLHIGLYEVDQNPTILNRDNGFWGGIDPLPFLIENSQIPKIPTTQIPQISQNPNEPTPETWAKLESTYSPEHFKFVKNAVQNSDWNWLLSSYADRYLEKEHLEKITENLEIKNKEINDQLIKIQNEKIAELEKAENEFDFTTPSKISSQDLEKLQSDQILKVEPKILEKESFKIDKDAVFGFIKNHLPEITTILSIFGYNSTQDQILQAVSITAPFIAGFISFSMEKIYKLNSKK
jgi:hypothetical protein